MLFFTIEAKSDISIDTEAEKNKRKSFKILLP